MAVISEKIKHLMSVLAVNAKEKLLRAVLLVLAGLVLVVVFVIWAVNGAVNQNQQKQSVLLEQQLRAALVQADTQLQDWVASEKRYLGALGHNTRLLQITKELLAQQPRTLETLSFAQAQTDMRAFFESETKAFGGDAFFIVAPDFTNISAADDYDLAQRNLIFSHYPELLMAALDGEAIFVPPIESGQLVDGHLTAGVPSLYFIAPIQGDLGNTIALIVQRVSPRDSLQHIFQRANVGLSGEVYAIDLAGNMLNKSRLSMALDDSVFHNKIISVRDPGRDIRSGNVPQDWSVLPLTKMASSVVRSNTRKGTELILQPYADYRGVPVIGVGVWSVDLGMGLIAEIDSDEAWQGYQKSRQDLWFVAGLTFVLALLFGAVMLWRVYLARQLLFANQQRMADITHELELRQQELMEQQQDLEMQVIERTSKFRSVIDTAADGVIVLNDDGMVEQFSSAAERMFGYSLSDVMGRRISMVIPELSRDYLSDIAFDPEQAARPKELLGVRESGEKFSAELAISSGGDIFDCFYTVIVRDVTERKDQEARQQQLLAALQKSQAGFQRLVDDIGSDFVIYSHSPTGEMLYCSETVQQVLGIDRQELIGQYWQSTVCWVTGDALMAQDYLERMAQREIDSAKFDMSFVHPNGELRTINVSVHPVWDAAGELVSFDGIAHHITEQKRIQEILIQAKQEAEEASKTKSDFLANMSHEIRTPMNAIIGLTDLCIRRTEPTEIQLDYLNKVHHSALTLLQIINDILDFSKIEAGKLDMEEISFDLSSVLENLTTLSNAKVQEKKLELLFLRQPDVPSNFVGDPLRLGQVLINLVNNAVKFTELGEIVVMVSLLKREANTVTLEFQVRDSGIGLSFEQQQRLFQSFSQVDSSITRKYGGTGLGLAICKRLVQMMGGEIRVESEQGKGSSFIFTVQMGVEADYALGEYSSVPELQQKRVLVVDDSAIAREILLIYFHTLGMRVDAVASAQDALDYLKQEGVSVDLLITDWLMPEHDGLWLATQVKSQLTSPPSVILASAFDSANIVGHQGAEFVSCFMTKPITLSNLFDTLVGLYGFNNVYPKRVTHQNALDDIDLAPLHGAKVLLVEDNVINQQVACELLRDAQVQIEIANNGQEALDILARDAEFDVVLMDVQMPVMGGYEATRRIREQTRFASLPILAMTADAMTSDRNEAETAGMNAHISKPVIPKELFYSLLLWVKPKSNQQNNPQVLLPKLIDTDKTIELPELPGVNTQQGLRHIGGNVAFYVKQLKGFVSQQANALNDLQKAFSAKDWETAIRITHTLKGVSATLGMTELHSSAKALELSLKEQDPLASDLLFQLACSFEKMLQLLQKAFVQAEAEQESVQEDVSLAELNVQLVVLQEKLAVYDAEAGEVLGFILAQVSGDVAQQLSQIQQFIHAYDFEAANAALASFMSSNQLEV